MERLHMKLGSKTSKILLGISLSLGLATGQLFFISGRAAAVCTTPNPSYGTITMTINVPTTTTYRIWSRIKAPDATNNTYLLEIDGGACYNVGGGSIPAATWTWVDYYGNTPGNKVQQSLTAGNHTLKLIGNKPSLKVDRVIALSDTGCLPTGAGDNCNVPSDTTPPAVALTAPSEGASVSGIVSLSATASDNQGVSKVDFYDGGSLIASDASSPYSTPWDTTKLQNGSHVLSARAYDTSGNVSSDSSTIIAKNGDVQAPSTPSNVKASAAAYNRITLTWSASTDNIAVAGYSIIRDGVPIATLGNITTFGDGSLSANTSYSYQVVAIDAAGNKSTVSSKAASKTPTVTDSEAPSKPAGLTATTVSMTQINLSWDVAKDNIGIVAYDIYRSLGDAIVQVVGTSTTTSYGDSNLTAGTAYTYYIIARDASSNASLASDTATGKTQSRSAAKTTSNVKGIISRHSSHKAIPYASSVLDVDGKRHTYQADRYGRYAIFDLATGKYNATFKAKSYLSETIDMHLSAKPLVQDIMLRKR